ncbi:MAG: DUF4097 family beta strand repeat protein [Clostridia bacterium]|nr:DUF4097 family beta strand repeat protein [Clostridia bacterium]
MKKSSIYSLSIAVVCIVIGLLIFSAVAASVKFDFRKLNTYNYSQKVTPVDEAFDRIVIDAVECDVNLVTAESASVTSMDSEDIITEVYVKDRTLHIKRQDKRPWYKCITLSFSFEGCSITVALPKNVYDSLDVTTLSGNISLVNPFEFHTAKLKTTSGDINSRLSAKDQLEVKTTSGEIYLMDVHTNAFELQSVSGDIKSYDCIVDGHVKVQTTSGDVLFRNAEIKQNLQMKTTSGDIELTAVETENVTMSTTSGGLELNDVCAAAAADISSVSGDIEFAQFDAKTVNITTTSGDVTGSFLTGKIFSTSSLSGDIRVPNTDVNGGLCTIKTTSGDIHIH